MKLEKIVKKLKEYDLFVEGSYDLDINYISYDSRDIKSILHFQTLCNNLSHYK